jgi:hypothetical protein
MQFYFAFWFWHLNLVAFPFSSTPKCFVGKAVVKKFQDQLQSTHARESMPSHVQYWSHYLYWLWIQEEKDCAYYMRTGSCKYGVTCKFHHPQPAAMGALVSMSGSSLYATPATQSSSTPQPYPAGLPSWPIAARAPYLQVPSTFAPVLVPPLQGVVSMTGWNTYQVSMLILHKDVRSCPPIYVFFWSVRNKLFV